MNKDTPKALDAVSAETLIVGGFYNWKGQPERLVYMGLCEPRNGHWHQFAKVDDPGTVWCEVRNADLSSFEVTQQAAKSAAASDEWLRAQIDEILSKPENAEALERMGVRVVRLAAKNAAPAAVTDDEKAALHARIAELEAELLPFKEAEAASIQRAQRRDRAESIANALFPRYDSVYARRHPEEKPPQWHEKSWWWNGVSVDFDESDIYDAYGTASLALSSYVGGGETDTTVVTFPAQWLEADSLVEPIAAFISEKTKAREAAKACAEAAEAQRQIDAAKATLRRLTGDQS